MTNLVVQDHGPAAGVLREIGAERAEQIEKHGHVPDADDRFIRGDLALIAALLASPARLFRFLARTDSFEFVDPWPMDTMDTKWDRRRSPDGRLNIYLPKAQRRANLIRAAALIVAEIERLDRIPPTPQAT